MNLLQFESSPYLLQHANNPVEWHAWNDVTLAKAIDSGKMMLISIGYSACHWCHVMERESFENEQIARIMNEHFLCIKVDREERPDVDQLYMQAAHLISGRGGWPLNAFALPDGSPFYAATYFPPSNWTDLLNQLATLWLHEPETIRNAAGQILHGIRSANQLHSPHQKSESLLNFVRTTDTTPPLSLQQLNELYTNYRHRIDFNFGGEKRAPKFPMPSMWEFLLHFNQVSKNADALKAVNSTLTNMARGGIYDHLGGGFARYSTDERWHVPHFEKMLYDNAQLITLYAHAYQHTGHSLYQFVMQETLEFAERELLCPHGGFYSAIDADSEGEEGNFYVWKEQEIESILGDEAVLFKEVFHITTEGNWEKGKNILLRKNSLKLHAINHVHHDYNFEDHLRSLRKRLLHHRSERNRPELDDKILCSWNALMIKACLVASNTGTGTVFDHYRMVAIQQLQFMLSSFLQEDGSLRRNVKDGKSSIEGMLDDYAFLISTLLEAYQTVFDESYITIAQQLTDYCLIHFSDPDDVLFFYTHQRSKGLVARMKERNDNVIPASNSEMAINLLFLGTLLDKPEYTRRARAMLTSMTEEISSNIYYHSNWAKLALLFSEGLTEVAIVGPDYVEWARELQKNYLPTILLCAAQSESSLPLLAEKYFPGTTRAFICRNNTCSAPVDNPGKLIEQFNAL